MWRGCGVQAELFRLEGMFHMALKDWDSADRAFSIALTLWPQLAAGWLSWGEFCDTQVSTGACMASSAGDEE